MHSGQMEWNEVEEHCLGDVGQSGGLHVKVLVYGQL